MSIAIKFIPPGEGGGNPLAGSAEDIVWIGRVSPREHLLFWLPRTVPWIFLWILSWTLAARPWVETDSSGTSPVSWLVPIGLAVLGLLALPLVPWSAWRATHLEYVVTRSRVLRIDRHACVTRFVWLNEIDGAQVIPGWGDDVGSIEIQAGQIAGPEGLMPLSFRVVAIADLKNAVRALNSVLNKEGGEYV